VAFLLQLIGFLFLDTDSAMFLTVNKKAYYISCIVNASLQNIRVSITAWVSLDRNHHQSHGQ
jgi:isoprenylcysteine carboxyl methyltransferase (ICMT) family protein YpbQ